MRARSIEHGQDRPKATTLIANAPATKSGPNELNTGDISADLRNDSVLIKHCLFEIARRKPKPDQGAVGTGITDKAIISTVRTGA